MKDRPVKAVPPELTAALDDLKAAVGENATFVDGLKAQVKTSMTPAEADALRADLTALAENLRAIQTDPVNPPDPPVPFSKRR